MDELKRNGSGYKDPTAYKALKHIDKNETRVKRVIKTLQEVAHLAGFEIEGRITLIDKRTGDIWR